MGKGVSEPTWFSDHVILNEVLILKFFWLIPITSFERLIIGFRKWNPRWVRVRIRFWFDRLGTNEVDSHLMLLWKVVWILYLWFYLWNLIVFRLSLPCLTMETGRISIRLNFRWHSFIHIFSKRFVLWANFGTYIVEIQWKVFRFWNGVEFFEQIDSIFHFIVVSQFGDHLVIESTTLNLFFYGISEIDRLFCSVFNYLITDKENDIRNGTGLWTNLVWVELTHFNMILAEVRIDPDFYYPFFIYSDHPWEKFEKSKILG